MQLDLLGAPQAAADDVVSSEISPQLTRRRTKAKTKAMGSVISHDVDVLEAQGTERDKAPEAFKTITEVAGLLEVQQYVLRFWESRFAQIKPVKMRGGRRYYRPEDIEVLQTIKNLLYKQGYTIKGAKKALSGRSDEAVAARKTAAKEAKVKAGFSDKEMAQLAVIRQELIGLRDVLKPYVF